MREPILMIPLRWEYPPTWWEYAEGYANAVELVLAELKRTLRPYDGGVPAFQPLGFPLFFLARHYLEISLKGALLNAAKLLRETPPDVTKFGHDLQRVWSGPPIFSPRLRANRGRIS